MKTHSKNFIPGTPRPKVYAPFISCQVNISISLLFEENVIFCPGTINSFV